MLLGLYCLRITSVQSEDLKHAEQSGNELAALNIIAEFLTRLNGRSCPLEIGDYMLKELFLRLQGQHAVGAVVIF